MQTKEETDEMDGKMSEDKDLIKAKHSLTSPSWADIKSRWARILSVSNRRDCSFCFFITGYFYLILGIVLMVGFKAIGPGMASMDWLKLQPYFTLGAGISLLVLAMVLMMSGNAVIKIAKYGTWLYIFSTIFNGTFIFMRPYLRVPHDNLFIIGFMATSALMGVMGILLAFAIQKIDLRPV